MRDEMDGFEDQSRRSRVPNSRQKSPRATRSTRHSKKPGAAGGSVGGINRRRNKHWSW